jgi:hypothetical protein
MRAMLLVFTPMVDVAQLVGETMEHVLIKPLWLTILLS